ncbi:MAG: hypothetical protein AAB401_07365 [Acidobacteriota bacterium]
MVSVAPATIDPRPAIHRREQGDTASQSRQRRLSIREQDDFAKNHRLESTVATATD